MTSKKIQRAFGDMLFRVDEAQLELEVAHVKVTSVSASSLNEASNNVDVTQVVNMF